jgi:glycyl-tRNA synthetase alpha subunit|tara:strand:+ start:3879 stop:4076 length:198 start_codon:yes stop_codon:yes gene_type:complete
MDNDNVLGIIDNMASAMEEIIAGLERIDAVVKTGDEVLNLQWSIQEARLYLGDAQMALASEADDD